MNKFKCIICITNPDTLHTQIFNKELSIDKINPDYQDMVTEFFRQWDNEDKYNKGYIIGINSMYKI